jgi:hypothetical protein
LITAALAFLGVLAVPVTAGAQICEVLRAFSLEGDGPSLTRQGRKVRPAGQMAAQLFADAMRQSAIVRRLVAQLDDSDVIVVLQVKKLDRAKLAGRTSLMAAPGTTRYVRVTIDHMHELQHVTEIAAEPAIRSQAGLLKYLKRAGIETGNNRFETEQALQVEQDIRRELAAVARSSG